MTSASPPAYFVHPKGLCESTDIGEGTRIWAFAHVLPGAKVGKACNICDQVFIENDVVIGDNVTIKCGVQLWDGLRVADGVFIGPNATFTNDRMPRSKAYPAAFLETTIEEDASIGANATILPGIRIGRGAMVGAGAVVIRDVPPHATVVGNPARIVGYRSRTNSEPVQPKRIGDLSGLPDKAGSRMSLGIGDAFIERLPNFIDMRGSLTPLQKGNGIPFKPERVFLVYGVESSEVRGEHAHRACQQFLVAAKAGVSVVLDNGSDRIEMRLTDPSVGLYLPPMIWGVQYKFDPDSVLMVLASRPYEPDDYVRNYEDFLRLVKAPE